MKNWEKYKDDILKVAITGEQCALRGDNIVSCNTLDCDLCGFRCGSCRKEFENWCQEEYEEPKIQEEVKHCKVDDKIMVSLNGKVWLKRYFAKYDENENMVYVFPYGQTSWSSLETSYASLKEKTCFYDYARLPKESEL